MTELFNMELPKRIASLPKNEAGYPVPWFVGWVDGKPDFRVMDERKLILAIKEKICWICGESMSSYKAFVIGPMCAVNRVSAEPPSHTDCAIFAAKACPFLTNPKQKRRETNLPEQGEEPAGIMIKRNPGVALVWVTKKYEIFSDGAGGVLFRIGDPDETFWFAHGHEATRQEVEESIRSGLPILHEMAVKEGTDAIAELKTMTDKAMELIPNR